MQNESDLRVAMEAAIAAYVPLGDKPARWAPFNSAIDADEPHGQIGPQELHDARLRFYFVEQDSKCVCNGKAIQPFSAAVIVELLRTHGDYRRGGIASALKGRVHADAAQGGATRSVITASPMGEKRYAALGYEMVDYHQSLLP